MAAVRFGLGIALAVLAVSPALAQDRAIRRSHDAIGRGDYVGAERLLAAEQRIFPTSAEVLVNLAAVYARTGRVQQAAALYRQVLQRDDVMLDLANDRAVSAHAIATTGLGRVASVQTATR